MYLIDFHIGKIYKIIWLEVLYNLTKYYHLYFTVALRTKNNTNKKK